MPEEVEASAAVYHERRYLTPHRDKIGRRLWDHVYYWMPIIFGFITMLMGMAMQYGLLEGRLGLFTYRLEQQEHKADKAAELLDQLHQQIIQLQGQVLELQKDVNSAQRR